MVRALLGAENVEAADRPLRIRNRRLQQPNEPPRHRLHAGAIEQVGSIVEPQPQLLARHRHQAQRIVRRIMPARHRSSRRPPHLPQELLRSTG